MTRALLTPEEFWRRYDAIEARLSAPLSERMLDLAAIAPGMRVLDVATGRGEPALRIAKRVGSHGSVLCVEPAAAILQIAREQAAQQGLTNLEFRESDAEALGDLAAGSFAAATMRWGLMYMKEPLWALRHIRRALVPGGLLVVALLAEPERMPYYTLPRQLLAKYRALPPIDYTAPGPFRYADPARIAADFAQAEFTVEHIDELDFAAFEGTVAEVVEWCRAMGLNKLVNELSAADQEAWESDLSGELERRRAGPTLQLGGVTRIAVARA